MNKPAIAFLCFLALFLPQIAHADCFLVKENSTIIKQEGDCKTRYSPCSTFKIAISLMGYNEGVLVDETHPEYPFKEGYYDYIEAWKQPHNPTLWMKNSSVWYSQVVTPIIGAQKFSDYVRQFAYGNQDVSGDKGKNNGLTHSWLSSSLEISPEEQIAFLQKLLNNTLPVSAHAHEMTRNILFIEDMEGGWKLYGKTGSGDQLSPDKTQKSDLKMGWFIGWLQKNDEKIIFAHFIQDKDKQDSYAGPRAREAAKVKLLELIRNREKEMITQ